MAEQSTVVVSHVIVCDVVIDRSPVRIRYSGIRDKQFPFGVSLKMTAYLVVYIVFIGLYVVCI